MTDDLREDAQVHVADTGVSVSIAKHTDLGDRVDVAAFSWVDGVDVERWAQDYAAALNRRHIGRNGRSE